jgi:hypothetical protein
MNEVRERFLKAILERLPVERIAEIHFFPSIRQGPVETGVAVIGAYPEPQHLAAVAVIEADGDAIEADGVAIEVGDAVELPPSVEPEYAQRHVVHTASYRWIRKGPDRGKWEVDVIAQADAPLPTVDVVVRGVQERSGEAIESQRLTAAELMAIVHEPSWQTAP